MKTIQIIIDPQGEIQLQTQGFSGQSCREASKPLEQALGLVRSDQPTAELYQQSAVQEAVRQKSGHS